MHANGYLGLGAIDMRDLCEQRPAIAAVKEISNLLRLLRRGLPSNTPLHVRRNLGIIDTLIESHWSELQDAVCGRPLPQRKRYCPECDTLFYLPRESPNGVTQQYCAGCASWRAEHGLSTSLN